MASIDFSKFADTNKDIEKVETPDVQLEQQEDSSKFEQYAVQPGDTKVVDFSKFSKQTPTSEEKVISRTTQLPQQITADEIIDPIQRSAITKQSVTRGFALATRKKVAVFAGQMVEYIPPATRQSLGNFFKGSFDEFDPNVSDKQLAVSTFLTTPTGEYLARLGASLDPLYLTEKLGIPDKFNMPDELKLTPGARAIIKTSGGDMDDVNDRVGLALGIDFLTGLGFDNLLFPIKDSKTASKVVNSVLSMQDDVRERYFDDLLKLADDGKLKPNSLNTIETTMEPKQLSFFGEKAVDPALSSNTIGDGYNVIDGMLVKMNPDGTSTAIKKATTKEVVNALLKNTMERERFIENFEKFIDKPENAPVAGRWGTSDLRNPNESGNILTAMRTPVYYAPKVDEVVGDMKALDSSLFEDYWGQLKQVEKLEGKEVSRLMFEVADGSPEAAASLEIIKDNPMAMRALKNWEKVADNIAEALNIPVENRKTQYMHHWFKDVQHKDYPTPEELKLWIKKQEGPLKKRKGVRGYETDFVSVTRKYVRWATGKISTDKYKKSIFEEVGNLKLLDKDKGRMAELAVYNYFGELSKAGGFPAWTNAGRNLKSTFVQGTLGFNMRAAWRNLSQTWTLGTQETSIPAVINGHKMVLQSMLGTKQGKVYGEIMRRSGLLTSTSEDLLEKSMGLWGGAFSKVFGKKKGADLIRAATSFQQASETFNKSVINLGRRAQLESKFKLVKSAPGKFRKVEQWLMDRGADLAENTETNVRRMSRQSTIKTQFDYSNWGQNLLTMNPLTSPFMVYMTWPIRGNEYLMHNARSTAKNLYKAIKNPKLLPAMLSLPETQATMMFGVQHSLNAAIKTTTGLSLGAIIGAPLYSISTSPILKSAEQVWNTANKVYKGDITAMRNLTRSAGAMSGFIFNSPAWMIADLIRVTRENMGRPGDKWSVTNPITKQHMYWVNPVSFFLDSLNSGVNTVPKEEYYKERKKAAEDFFKKKGLRAKLDQALEKRDTEKAREIKQKLREESRKQKKRSRLHKKNQKKSIGGYSHDGEFF